MIFSMSFNHFPSHSLPRPNLFEMCCSHQIQKTQIFTTIYEVREVKHHIYYLIFCIQYAKKN